MPTQNFYERNKIKLASLRTVFCFDVLQSFSLNGFFIDVDE